MRTLSAERIELIELIDVLVAEVKISDSYSRGFFAL